MTHVHRVLLAAALLAAAPLLLADSAESSITSQLKNLRSVPIDKRPAATLLPAGQSKLKLADALCHLSTEGDAGHDTLQAVADTLAKSLAESPVPAKGDQPPMPYLDLAQLVRYEQVNATLDDPLFAKAQQTLAAQDAEVEKADFTLKDLHNKKVTLSELRGKIVMVNFWATWCGPCRLEMPDLDRIYTHFESQGLVVLSITDEDSSKVSSFLAPASYHPPVLLDPDGKVHKLFHVEGIPRTFVFNREGKLVAEAIDQRTLRQFLGMLQKTDLHN
jgi:thiol-disulfide isomerase/thioredoxin